ncbi:unnamed protein product, partial [Dicrocoelium dendriticum]
MGDFNQHCVETAAMIGKHFKADLQDLVTGVHMYNHISMPTRLRTGNRLSGMDFVLTNEEHMIDMLAVDGQLGRSDHAVNSVNFVRY